MKNALTVEKACVLGVRLALLSSEVDWKGSGVKPELVSWDSDAALLAAVSLTGDSAYFRMLLFVP